MTKICHLTSVHAWNDVRIFEKECRSLVEAGFEVHLVAAYGPRQGVGKNRGVDGVFRGEADGVQVHLLDAPSGRLARATALAWRIAGYARGLGARIYHFHDPELLPHAAMRLAAGRRVYDVHEDLALQVGSKPWIPDRAKPAVSAAVRVVERPLARRCDAVVGATPEVMERFLAGRTEGVDAVVVANAPRAEWTARDFPAYEERPRRIVYVGALTEARGVTDLVDAMADERLTVASEGLDLAGPASDEYLAALRARPGFARTTYHGVLAPQGVARLLGGARVGVAALHAYPNYAASRPIKLGEYLAAGLAVVASDFPLWRSLYGMHDGLRFVAPGEPSRLAAELAEALMSPPPQIDRATLPSWEDEARKLVSLYRRLLSRG